jgi:hypothetical protein
LKLTNDAVLSGRRPRAMRRTAARLLAPLLALAFGGCAGPSAPACANGRQAMTSELLYFGTAMPQGVVTAEAWRGFVDEVVTPRFPDGLTAWPASGQWRPAGGALVHEASWVLNVVHAPDARSDAAIADIIEAYRKRFRQDSVLRVSTAACVAF